MDINSNAKIETATDWAINNGFTDIDTNTSDEFVAWQERDCDSQTEYTPSLSGIKVWHDQYRERYIAIRRYENGEQMGNERGFGDTMLAALQDM